MTADGIAKLPSRALLAAILASGCGDGAIEPSAPPSPVPSAVTVSPASATLQSLGVTVRLTAAVRDQNGQAMSNAAVAWESSNPSVATVDASGLATAVGNGTATVTATAGSASGAATLTVDQVVAAVTVEPAADTVLAFGDTLRLSAAARDANGHAVVAAEFVWASGDTLVAVVDASGLVTGVSAGEADIAATSSDVTGQSRLTVLTPTPETVAVAPDTVVFHALGQAARLLAEVRDAAGRVMAGELVTWASGDTLVVTVDSTGLATAVRGGTTAIVASAGSVSAEATVTVEQLAGSVVVSPPADTIAPGGTVQLVAEAFDDNGHAAEGVPFRWSSSDASVARVDASGLVTGVGEGRATVAAVSGDARATADITVENPDRAVLVAFYNATDGPNWHDGTNWLTDRPVGEWHGVDTDAWGRVVRLDLSGPTRLNWGVPVRNGGVRGPIPSELADLARLTRLNLGGNDLSGPIPSELGGLANLVELSLDDNVLTGPVPPELATLTRLQILNVSGNRLEGAIPPELGNFGSLTQLKLARNLLSGAIPRGLLALANLRVLSLEGSGELCAPGTADFRDWLEGIEDQDAVWCSEPDRAVLEMLHEATGGPGWTDSEGWLGGPILDDWHGVRVDSLGRVVALALDGNGLSGRLPPRLGALERMTELGVGGNPDLTGRLPSSLTRLSLQTFDYAGTGLCAPVEASFRDWLGTIPSHNGSGVECVPMSDRTILEALYKATDGPNWANDENWLTDAPPGDWYGVDTDASGRVVRLRLRGLTGSLPPELGGLARLERLDLGANALTGPIPPELGDLADLEELNLGTNSLTGPIPPELGNLASLRAVYFDRNNLTGPIPPELGGLANLTRLYLYRNDLSGPIPPELGDLANLTRLYLNHNELSGPIPPELGGLTDLTRLVLDHNRLSGPIPPELGDLANLTRLHLNENDLSGPVPPELVRLTRLERLNFNDNRDLCIPHDPELRAWLIARGFTTLPCPDPGASRTLLRVLLREDSNGLSVLLPDDLHEPAAVNPSDPAVVAAREESGWLVLSPLGLGSAEVEVVPSGVGDPAYFGVVVRPAVGTFGIDVVMTQPALVGYEEAMTTAADWWSSVLKGTEWPDREITAEDSESCYGRNWKFWKVKGTPDEVVIVTANRHGAGAWVGACLKRGPRNADGTVSAHYPLAGHVMMDPRLGWAGHNVGVMKHEIGHMLGLVMPWLVRVGLATQPGDEPEGGDLESTKGHFLGRRALEAFRAGGGDRALDALPYDWYGHWRPQTVPCDLMANWCEGVLGLTDAVSLAALADMGYTVDMSKATPWRRRDNAAASAQSFPHHVVVVELPDPPLPGRDPPR